MLVQEHSKNEPTNDRSVQKSGDIMKHRREVQDLVVSIDFKDDHVAISVLITTAASWHNNHRQNHINDLISSTEKVLPTRRPLRS